MYSICFTHLTRKVGFIHLTDAIVVLCQSSLIVGWPDQSIWCSRYFSNPSLPSIDDCNFVRYSAFLRVMLPMTCENCDAACKVQRPGITPSDLMIRRIYSEYYEMAELHFGFSGLFTDWICSLARNLVIRAQKKHNQQLIDDHTKYLCPRSVTASRFSQPDEAYRGVWLSSLSSDVASPLLGGLSSLIKHQGLS